MYITELGDWPRWVDEVGPFGRVTVRLTVTSNGPAMCPNVDLAIAISPLVSCHPVPIFSPARHTLPLALSL